MNLIKLEDLNVLPLEYIRSELDKKYDKMRSMRLEKTLTYMKQRPI